VLAEHGGRAYDLKVFFTVVGKPPRRVRRVDVLVFMTAQRAGGQGRLLVTGDGAGRCQPGCCGGCSRACPGCTVSGALAVM